MRQDNEKRLDVLAEKAKAMVEITSDIESEVRESSRLIEEMNSGVAKANQLVMGAITKVGELASTGGGGILSRGVLSVAAAFLIVFFIIYFLSSAVFSSPSSEPPPS